MKISNKMVRVFGSVVILLGVTVLVLALGPLSKWYIDSSALPGVGLLILFVLGQLFIKPARRRKTL